MLLLQKNFAKLILLKIWLLVYCNFILGANLIQLDMVLLHR